MAFIGPLVASMSRNRWEQEMHDINKEHFETVDLVDQADTHGDAPVVENWQYNVRAHPPINQDCINVIILRRDIDRRVQQYATFENGQLEWHDYSGFDVLRVTFAIDGLYAARGLYADEELVNRLTKLASQASELSTTVVW